MITHTLTHTHSLTHTLTHRHTHPHTHTHTLTHITHLVRMTRLHVGGKTIVIRPIAWVVSFLFIFILMVVLLFINTPSNSKPQADQWNNEYDSARNLPNSHDEVITLYF